MDENLEITENAARGLLIALASAMLEQGDHPLRRKLLRHLDARIDALANRHHPVWTPMWNPTEQDLLSLRSMRQWLHHELEAPTIPHL